MNREIKSGLVAALAICWLAPLFSQVSPGWGVDACITRHVADAEFPAYVRLLKASGVKIVRERDVGVRHLDGSYGGDVRQKFRVLKDNGFIVVAFVSKVVPLSVSREGDALPEDLREVYHLGQVLRRDFAGLVDAWEMTGEPDVGFCRDLPERTVAYQKALYLGFMAGGGRPPIVMMGALALPPGPWFDRAAANGLLDYSDAYNFHFYGHAEDLIGVIRAHRAFMEGHVAANAGLPLWITECGIKAVRPNDFLDVERRRMQADFTVATAREAREEGAAVFMPFILVERTDPYALTLSSDRPLPAWDAYSALTRDLSWPARPLSRAPLHADPVVMQWLPDDGAAIPHKVSGTYRFRDGRPMSGELRIYNLGAEAVHGRFEGEVPPEVASTFPGTRELTLAPGQLVVLRGAFAPGRTGYFEAWWRGEFVSDDGSRSPLSFGLEKVPDENDFVVSALNFAAPSDANPIRPIYPKFRASAAAGPWVGINGVQVIEASASGALFRVTELTGDPAGDPLYPPMAVAGLNGLPRDGFLVVRPDRMMNGQLGVRVDLVDRNGGRFTIWENFGQSYAAPRRDLWLNFRDFHPYFWGRCADDPRFRPEDIREMQLRFYSSGVGRAIRLDFSLARPR